jgi:hypothetical protein
VLLDAFAHDVRIEHPLRLDVEDADPRHPRAVGRAVPRARHARRRTTRRGFGPGPARARRSSHPRRRAGSRPKIRGCC